jgi:hypothetical protein
MDMTVQGCWTSLFQASQSAIEGHGLVCASGTLLGSVSLAPTKGPPTL